MKTRSIRRLAGLWVAVWLAGAGGAQAQFTVLHTFTGSGTDGAYPQGSLALSGTTLYGMTQDGGGSHKGVVFSMDTQGGNYTTLHSFTGSGTDGAYPSGSLLITGSTLYGMTPYGGGLDQGIMFSMGTGGGAYSTLGSFDYDGSSGAGRPLGSWHSMAQDSMA